MNEAELESLEQYQVGSPREIVALLRQIGDKNQLVRMLIDGQDDVCITSILGVDEANNNVILDRSIDRAQNERIVNASHVACETALDKIRILFELDYVCSCSWQGDAALRAPLPASLIRLQRREYYRMETPVTTPVKATVPLPALDTGFGVFPLHDISVGGVALLDNRLELEDLLGKVITGVQLELPDIGVITTSLEIRNVHEVTMLNNKVSRRLGCEFYDISRGSLAAVQRYITRLERERNARLAGLA